jgi:phosphatidylserine/phosphatidylglycerophosphate/cardiolipin synthase-like enzyme
MRYLFLFLCFVNFCYADVSVLFSPHGACQKAIIDVANKTEKTLDCEIYSLTDPGITSAIIAAKERGVIVRVIADKTEAKTRSSTTNSLKAAGVDIREQHGSGGGIMHNKIMIADGTTVVAGSFNWTTRAEAKNDENLIIINDPAIAIRYTERFESLWSKQKN